MCIASVSKGIVEMAARSRMSREVHVRSLWGTGGEIPPVDPAEASVIFGWQLQLRGSLLLPLLPFAMVWPAAYIVASASWRRWRGRDGLGSGIAAGP